MGRAFGVHMQQRYIIRIIRLAVCASVCVCVDMRDLIICTFIYHALIMNVSCKLRITVCGCLMWRGPYLYKCARI